MLRFLLDAHEASSWLLDKPIRPLAEQTNAEDSPRGNDRPTDTLTKSGDERIGKFEQLKEIGRGGMGVVYQAWHADLERQVAIKVQRPTKQVPEEALSTFKREARAFAKLDHPISCEFMIAY